jgi:aminoglycoside phosphotransferase (APT) family kinase protein
MWDGWAVCDGRSGLDATLLAWLVGEALPGRRVAATRPMPGGFRNGTMLVVTDTGERYVLRRYSDGSACPVEVALCARVGGVVPVPEIVAADVDGGSAGSVVALSRFVPGVPVTDALTTGADLRQLGHAVGGALAAVGTVAFPAPGLFRGPDLVPQPCPAMLDLPGFVDHCLDVGPAASLLTPDERRRLRELAGRLGPHVAAVRDARQLVHSDYNPKNLLVRRAGGEWAVSAVLDWEFALSGSPLVDVGNMLRFRHELPHGYAEGFLAGFTDAGGHLPEGWETTAQALDLFALADFLTRQPDHMLLPRMVGAIRRQLDAP